MKIPFQKLHPNAKMPERKSEDAAGYDLTYCGENHVNLWPQSRQGFETGLAAAIPRGYYGRIAPRSGLARKKGLDVLGGVIDADYRGELVVILCNTGTVTVEITPGERIAQLIIERCHDAEFIEFESLEQTARGQGGFGSTDFPSTAHDEPCSGETSK
jgi:dUTP pyrophosphatase